MVLENKKIINLFHFTMYNNKILVSDNLWRVQGTNKKYSLYLLILQMEYIKFNI